MKIYTLHQEQVVPHPLLKVFHYFSRPENLSQLTPPWMDFQILTPLPIEMKKGARIHYKIKIRKFSLRWETEIIEYDPPYSFVDVQQKGPYLQWHHRHRFEPVDQGTRILDEVKYALPLGWIGQMAHKLQVRKDLEAIFNYRKQVLTQVFD